MSNPVILLAYRKYKAWDLEQFVNKVNEYEGSEKQSWSPYSLDEFKGKAFDYDDSEFIELFDKWYDEAKLELR